jgi:hypothetical protein
MLLEEKIFWFFSKKRTKNELALSQITSKKIIFTENYIPCSKILEFIILSGLSKQRTCL